MAEKLIHLEDATPAVQAAIKRRIGGWSDRQAKAVFIALALNPPIHIYGDGVIIRRTGSSLYYPYWYAYDDAPQMGRVRGSQADTAVKAGKFRRSLEDQGLLPIIPAIKSDPVTGRKTADQPSLRNQAGAGA